MRNCLKPVLNQFFLPSTTGGFLGPRFGVRDFGVQEFVSPAVWQESLAVQLYVALSLKHQADSGGSVAGM